MMKSKRVIPAILSLTITVSLLTACQPQAASSKLPELSKNSTVSETVEENGSRELVGNTYKTGLPIIKDPEKFRIVVEHHPMDKSKSFNEKEIVRQLQEETGIEIEWKELLSSDLDQKIPLLLASDLPDAFLGGFTLSDANFAKNLKSFVSIEPYMNDGWMPNVLNSYKKASELIGFDVKDQLSRQTDGNIYSLIGGSLTSNDSSVTGVQFINTRWLKNVGLEIPKTQDEFYAVLKAFKEKDANGNGDSNDEIPLEFCNNFWAGNIKDMFGYWGFTGYYNVEDGKVIPTMNTEDFKNALVFYNKLANEGLLDVEGFSQTREQFSSKVKQGKVGVSLFWSPVEFISDDSALDYKFMPPFAANGYSGKPQLRGRYNKVSTQNNSFVITTKCKNPTALLRWWDYIATDSFTRNEFYYGPIKSEQNPTGLFEEKDGKYTVLTDGDYSVDFSFENAKYTYQINNSVPLAMPEEIAQIPADPNSPLGIRKVTCDEAIEFLPKDGLPYRNQPADKSAEFALKTTDLSGFIDNFIATSIVDGVTDASWNKYVEDLDKYNYGYYIQYYQDFLDGKF